MANDTSVSKTADRLNVPADDAIAEVYLENSSVGWERRARARIDWMCAEARGETALDIGCGQGILPLLLAQTGMLVTGVDVKPRALYSARKLIAGEPAKVRKRVVFRLADATKADFIEGEFDTVFIGEVIEHLLNPDLVIAAASDRLAPGGAIILTTPHGYLPHDDHHQVFGVEDVIELLPKALSVASIDIVDGYIRLRAERTEKAPARPEVAHLLSMTTRSLIEQQKLSDNIVRNKDKALSKTARHLETKSTQNDILTTKLSEESARAKRAKAELAEERRRPAELERQLVAFERQNADLTSKLDVEIERALELDLWPGLIKQKEAIARLKRSATYQTGLTMRLIISDPIHNLAIAPYRLWRLLRGKGLNLSDPYERPAEADQRTYAPNGQGRDSQAFDDPAIAAPLRARWMNTKHKALSYAESIFKMASDYDVAATDLLTLAEQLGGLKQPFPNLSKPADIDDGPISFTLPAFGGGVEFSLFSSAGTSLEEHDSFLCSVKAVDIANRSLPIGGLRESKDTKIGHYFYIGKMTSGMCTYRFAVPAATETVTFSIQRFRKSDDRLVLKSFYQLLPQGFDDARRKLVEMRGQLLDKMRAPREDLSITGTARLNNPSFIYVMDEFTESCILSALPRGYRLLRNSFISQISKADSTMLFLESTWNGNNGEWKGAMTYDNPVHEQKLSLKAAIHVAKAKGLRTVFYNKEDPMHFDRFLPIAAEADVIFTSDSDCVSRYKEEFPDKTVEVMKFAAPTATCNPAGAPTFEDRKSVAFAGGYYGENHDDRVEQMEYILPAIEALNGTIFDRHSEQSAERYRYPLRYQPFCHPSISYPRMVSQYRQFKVFLNVNTIVSSPTMLSRRVYELLACGTPVISSPSAAIIEQFGDAVTVVDNAEQAISEVRRLVSNKTHWMKRSHLGYRHVMNGNTYDDRAEQIMRAGNDIDAAYEQPFVSIVTPTKEPGDYVRIIENAFAQNYDKLELVVGFGHLYSESDVADFLKEFQERARRTGRTIRLRHVHFHEKVILGYKLNALMHEATGEVIAKMDDDDYYGPNYISDMILPMRWGGFDLIGKRNAFWCDVVSGKFYLKNLRNAHRALDLVYGATFVGRRTMFLRNPFPERRTGEDTLQLAQLKSNGHRIYSADPFNFCCLRRANQHTWDLPTDFWEKDCEELPEGFGLDDIGI